MAQPHEVHPAHSQAHTRRKSGCPGRRVERPQPAANSRQLRAEAERVAVPAGFLQPVQHVLVPLIALRILERNIHFRKNAQIVQLALRVDDSALRQRIAGLQRDAVVDQPRPRRFVSAHQHTADKIPPAFDHVDLHVHAPRGRVRLCPHFQRRVRISAVEIEIQNRIPVGNQRRVRERLALRRLQQSLQILEVAQVHAVDLHAGDKPLRPFVDRQEQEHLFRLGLLVALHPRRYFDVSKPIRPVQIFDRLHVLPHQLLAVPPIAIAQNRRRRNRHALANRPGVEILVPLDVQPRQPISRPPIHRIQNGLRTIGRHG